MNLEHMDYIEGISDNDIAVLRVKEFQTYGGSWKKRGGTGAFFVIARKWDALENILAKAGTFDVLSVGVEQGEGDGTVIEQIRDLRRYLLLAEAEMVNLKSHKKSAVAGLGRSKALTATQVGAYGENAVADRPKAHEPAIDPTKRVPATAEWTAPSDDVLGIALGGVYKVFAIGSDFVRLRNSRNEMVWLPTEHTRLNYNEE